MKKSLFTSAACLAAAWMLAAPAQAADWVAPEVIPSDDTTFATLMWPDGYEVEVDDAAEGIIINYTNFDYAYLEADETQIYADGQYMYLIFPDDFTPSVGDELNFELDKGDYTLTYAGEEVTTQDISVTWILGGGDPGTDELTYTSSYADGEATFQFPAGYGVELKRGSAVTATLSKLNAYTEEYEETATYGSSNISVSGNYSTYEFAINVTIEEADIAEPGFYQLIVPSTAYIVTNVMTSTDVETVDLVVEFEVITQGIDAISAENVTFRVYNAAGVCVMENATSTSISSLPRGIYIANGKKILVK